MDALMRIGQLSRRTGVSPELLRAWEHRYGLLRPTRSSGGFRLYSVEDEARVRRTSALIADGHSAAEAARLASSSPADDIARQPLVDELAAQLSQALDDFDPASAHAALDRLFGVVTVESAVTDVVIPYLHDLGERWASGSVTVAQEHFASHLVRGRLLGLARDGGTGGASSALLACLPGEAHDIGLIILGILLGRRGWRVTFLGADTPLDTITSTARVLRPSVVVLATYDPAIFEAHARAMKALTNEMTVAVLAPVDEAAVIDTGASPLVGDLRGAAAALALP
jgi:DNA-binding transcriptional MerR regulator